MILTLWKLGWKVAHCSTEQVTQVKIPIRIVNLKLRVLRYLDDQDLSLYLGIRLYIVSLSILISFLTLGASYCSLNMVDEIVCVFKLHVYLKKCFSTYNNRRLH